MPTTAQKNLVYRLALPFLAPSPRGKMSPAVHGHAVGDLPGYMKILTRHHVMGSTLLLQDGGRSSVIHVSVGGKIAHHADDTTLYRVASITKTAATLVALRLCQRGLLSLDTPVSSILADFPEGITLRMLLSHTSGLRDTAAYTDCLQRGGTWQDVLATPGAYTGKPGASFAYSNFGFGMLGCIFEQLTGNPLSQVFDEELFAPLGMEATLDASTLDEGRVMPITRVLARRREADVRIPPLGRIPLTAPDPLRHFGHTAGSMYTNARSLSRMLTVIHQRGDFEGQQFLAPDLIDEMIRPHASYGAISPGMSYGLGLIFQKDDQLPEARIAGHQGYAYGCVDGAFLDLNTGRQVISLNGGASEARDGRMGLINQDVLRWALGKELPSWK